MALLKSGCIKFGALFLRDTGIDHFRSCTFSGACMHVFHTSHLKENTIARVPPNGFRSMRNYPNKSDKIGKADVEVRVTWIVTRCPLH